MDPRISAAVVDLFVYVVVLNLFVEYLPSGFFPVTLLILTLLLARTVVRRLLSRPVLDAPVE